MTIEHGVLIVLTSALVIALVSRNSIQRAIALKICADALAVSLLGFGSGPSAEGLRIASALIVTLGTVLLFVYLLFTLHIFKTKEHEQTAR
ncbi:MAG TPA: hypothetical protein VFV50_19380 [Bdellovibrionales bacterium]|nr:hypothetical protein [Bdellovibrionales bacterium]